MTALCFRGSQVLRSPFQEQCTLGLLSLSKGSWELGGLISGDDKIQGLQTSKNRKIPQSMLNIEKLFLQSPFSIGFSQISIFHVGAQKTLLLIIGPNQEEKPNDTNVGSFLINGPTISFSNAGRQLSSPISSLSESRVGYMGVSPLQLL